VFTVMKFTKNRNKVHNEIRGKTNSGSTC